jgi:hypothetical protein
MLALVNEPSVMGRGLQGCSNKMSDSRESAVITHAYTYVVQHSSGVMCRETRVAKLFL